MAVEPCAAVISGPAMLIRLARGRGHPPSRCRAGAGPDRAEARELIAGTGYGGPLGEVIRLKRRGHDP